jgi:hypothetical protein
MDKRRAPPAYSGLAIRRLNKGKPPTDHDSFFALTRRSVFLGSGGAFIASTALGALPDDLNIIVDRDKFTITLAGRAWPLRHATLGVQTKIYYKQRRNKLFHKIEVNDAATSPAGCT